MRIAENWKDYELLDCSGGERLERWGDVILIRPDPQVIWNTPRKHPAWRKANAKYLRSKTGGGSWDVFHGMPDQWKIGYRNLTFQIKAMGFKHTGIFPEQAVNWDTVSDMIRNAGRPVKVLNLFGYTGAATLACMEAGASVVHVDASKGMVQWAKENAKASGLQDKPVRWIVDDCMKFVQREIRRGNKYDILIMDPPSYGRGPGGEVWKLEESLYGFLETCMGILSDNAIALFLNSYTAGLSSAVMQYALHVTAAKKFGGSVSASEIGLLVSASGAILPCGATAIWSKEK